MHCIKIGLINEMLMSRRQNVAEKTAVQRSRLKAGSWK